MAVTLVVQDGPVVGLTTRLIDASRSGRRLQVLTPATTRLTLPAADLLRCDDANWVVRSGDSHFDGHTGHRMRWDGEGFVPTGPAVAAAPAEGLFVVDVAVHHVVTPFTELGCVLEECVAALTGGVVTGWGTAEPVTQRWNRDGMTEFCRERAPDPTKLVVVGGTAMVPTLGTLTAVRVQDGLLEHIRIGIPNPMPVDPLFAHLRARYDVRLALATQLSGSAC